jgi:hypothetical protein
MPPNEIVNGTACGAEAWSVFVVFDDMTARQHATRVCDFISARFWPDIEFEIHWCALSRLGSPECAKKAVNCATGARIVIVATSAREVLPQTAVAWLDEWCAERRGREGALIGLIEEDAESEMREKTDQFLRSVAHRAGLDYLTHAPECGLTPMPDETGWITAKTEQMGSVLDNILTKPTPVPRPGRISD